MDHCFSNRHCRVLALTVCALAFTGCKNRGQVDPRSNAETDPGERTAGQNFKNQPFDPELWRNHEAAQPQNAYWPPRLCMINDLLKQHEFKGFTRVQVTELLSVPDETGYFKKMGYGLLAGSKRVFIRIDSEWLVLRLDGGDTVSEYKLVTDERVNLATALQPSLGYTMT